MIKWLLMMYFFCKQKHPTTFLYNAILRSVEKHRAATNLHYYCMAQSYIVSIHTCIFAPYTYFCKKNGLKLPYYYLPFYLRITNSPLTCYISFLVSQNLLGRILNLKKIVKLFIEWPGIFDSSPLWSVRLRFGFNARKFGNNINFFKKPIPVCHVKDSKFSFSLCDLEGDVSDYCHLMQKWEL